MGRHGRVRRHGRRWPRRCSARSATSPWRVALGLFALGCVAFLWAYWLAVQRSRTDEIGIGGLFFLAGKDTAPPRPKWLLLGALATQVVVALVTASVRPYTHARLRPAGADVRAGLHRPVGRARYGQFGPRVGRRPRRRPTAGLRRAQERAHGASRSDRMHAMADAATKTITIAAPPEHVLRDRRRLRALPGVGERHRRRAKSSTATTEGRPRDVEYTVVGARAQGPLHAALRLRGCARRRSAGSWSRATS